MDQIIIETPYNESGGTIRLVAHYWTGTENKAVALFHMMPATKDSWYPLAKLFNDKGYHVLAPDLRGHGDSTQGTNSEGKPITLDFTQFNDLNHQDTIFDVERCIQFFVDNGIAPDEIYLGGASIGANLVIKGMSKHPEIKKGFALSPGLDYRGIKTESAIKNMLPDQKLMLIAAEDDDYSNHSVSRLSEVGEVQKEFKLFPSGGHGTSLFQTQPEILNILVNWI